MWMICDEHGDAITDGLDESRARAHAQQIANSRGGAVWLYGPDDTDDTAERFDPDEF